MNRAWLGIFFSALLWSGINPKDTMTWMLEVAPALIGLMILLATRRTFPLTRIAYYLILLHSLILMVGGHYTYAEVPLFDWLKQIFHQERNNYDKIGHFAQGFVPAVLAREILIRKAVIAGRAWLNFMVIAICLAISASYELLEWCIVLMSEEATESFLGTQGYIWDTQSDMAFALIGAITALLFMSSWHDRQIDALTQTRSQ
jgi:putative membrane protein